MPDEYNVSPLDRGLRVKARNQRYARKTPNNRCANENPTSAEECSGVRVIEYVRALMRVRG